MTDDQRVESVVRAVRWLRDDGDALTFFEGWLRDEFHTRAEQAEVEVERLRNEVGAGIWVPAEQFLVLRAENEAMRAAIAEAAHGVWAEAHDTEWDAGFNHAMKLVRNALAPFTKPERGSGG